VHPQQPVTHRRGSRALYSALTVPLATGYAVLFAGLVVSVALAPLGIGVPMFVALLAVARGVGGWERRLARRLLGADAPAVDRLRRGPLRPALVRRLVPDAGTWRTVGWLGVRVLSGAWVLTAVAVGLAGWVLVIGPPPWIGWTPWTAPALVVLLALIMVAVLIALDLVARVAAAVAPRLLGPPPDEQLVELRRTSQGLADRNRLARDLHDTIGHSLTASLLQATAARRTLTPRDGHTDQPVQAAFALQALDHIEVNTRTALAQLDRALAILRGDPVGTPGTGSTAGRTSLADLPALVAGLDAGGLPITLDVDGRTDDLPPSLGDLAYRIAQEALTNVLRHAGGAATDVAIVRTSEGLVVRVHNEPPLIEGGAGPRGGSGLAGLAERAAAVGGRVVAGPTSAGGFELRATLPLSGAMPEPRRHRSSA
jgi:signal transduction histidine kinase